MNSRQVPRLPLVLESVADIELLRTHARAVRRLPRAGPKVAILGLEPTRARQLEQRIQSYIEACGCAEGAAMAMIGMLSILGWLAHEVVSRGVRWSDLSATVAGLLLAVLAAGLGKMVGIGIARLRFELSCARAIRSLREQAANLPAQGTSS